MKSRKFEKRNSIPTKQLKFRSSLPSLVNQHLYSDGENLCTSSLPTNLNDHGQNPTSIWMTMGKTRLRFEWPWAKPDLDLNDYGNSQSRFEGWLTHLDDDLNDEIEFNDHGQTGNSRFRIEWPCTDKSRLDLEWPRAIIIPDLQYTMQCITVFLERLT